eukprot:m51a1_g4047 hypothetical protein (274) ;mRNA; r:690632-691772
MRAFVVLVLLAACSGALAQRPKALPKETVPCESCLLLVRAVEDWLASEKTEATIDNLVRGVCKVLPSKDTDMCQKLISIGTHELIKMLETLETPETICAQIGACTAPAPAPDACAVCTYLVHDVQGWLADSKNVDEIAALTKQLCMAIPSAKWQQTCTAVAAYGVPDLVQLVTRVGAEDACRTIKVCPAAVAVGPLECTACELVVGFVEGWATSQRSVEWMEAEVAKFCNITTPLHARTCETVADRGIVGIVELLKLYATPSRVCTVLGLCLV